MRSCTSSRSSTERASGRRGPATGARRQPPAGAGVPVSRSAGGSTGWGSAPGTVAGSGTAPLSGSSQVGTAPLRGSSRACEGSDGLGAGSRRELASGGGQRGPSAGPSSVTLVPLLLPRVAPVVIAVLLPEAGLVPLQEGDPADPLGALPEVQVRHQHPHRTAVLHRQRAPVELPDQPRLAAGDVL